MKRSEFAKIVNEVSNEELKRLSEKAKECSEAEKDALPSMIAGIASSIPATAARTTADILVRSGLLQLEDD